MKEDEDDIIVQLMNSHRQDKNFLSLLIFTSFLSFLKIIWVGMLQQHELEMIKYKLPARFYLISY